MKYYVRILLTAFLIFGSEYVLLSQNNAINNFETIISGRVKSDYTDLPISGVNVFIESINKGTVSDQNGNFKMIVPKGLFKITFSAVNLETKYLDVDVIVETSIEVSLKERTLNLQEVTVFSEKEDANIKSLDVGKNVLDIKRISTMPSFLGEPDVIKALLLLPGVSTVGEGAGGFNVRGGSVDQNLIIQDGALIFNPSHMFGFFSVFNSSVVRNAVLYKNGIPAKYGGRLSSVLDVTTKEGNYNNYKVDGGVGLVTSNLTVQGPILKRKLSFIIGARASYADWILNQAKDLEIKQSSADFQDLNTRLSYIINDKNKLSYSGYYSNDGFKFASEVDFQWTSINHGLHWNYLIDEKSNLDVDAVIGSYSTLVKEEEDLVRYDVNTSIKYQKLALHYDNTLNEKHLLGIGLESTFYQFNSGDRQVVSENTSLEDLKLEEESSIESGIYIQDEIIFSPKFSTRIGLRVSHFLNYGPGVDYVFGSDDSKNQFNIVDTLRYDNNEIIASYAGLEPRVNMTFEINEKSSLKGAYNRSYQYLHLVSNTVATSPNDIWKTSNKYILPEISDQFSLGYFRNFKDNEYEASAEVYYKYGQNIVDFKNGKDLFMNEYVEADLISGVSESYGLELFLNKKLGTLTGWMSYTYSRSFRKVLGNYPDETISNGNKYPSNYDKPHDFTSAIVYNSTPLVSYGVNFTYSTGRAITSPEALYDLGLLTNVYSYSLRNQNRTPDYHRLDLSMTVKSYPKKSRKWNMSWTFAVYNVYGRRNAYSLFYANEIGEPPSEYRLSILGNAFPSLRVDFNF